MSAGSASGPSLHLRNLVSDQRNWSLVDHLVFYHFSSSTGNIFPRESVLLFVLCVLDFFIRNVKVHCSLDGLYGTWRKASTSKAGWNLPQPKMANTDLSALLKSEAIRAVLRAPNRKVSRAVVRTNPLKNIRTMLQVRNRFSLESSTKFLLDPNLSWTLTPLWWRRTLSWPRRRTWGPR